MTYCSVTREKWLEMTNSPDDRGNVRIDFPAFSYYDNAVEYEITVTTAATQEHFGYANSGMDQARKRATDFLLREKALHFVD